MTTRRVPKDAVRTRMASTGESYQQALAAVRAQVPEQHLLPQDDGPCVGRCLSAFLATIDGPGGGPMTDCARCPGQVCLDCGRAPVETALARCAGCEEARRVPAARTDQRPASVPPRERARPNAFRPPPSAYLTPSV
jgi:hypothetical protein